MCKKKIFCSVAVEQGDYVFLNDSARRYGMTRGRLIGDAVRVFVRLRDHELEDSQTLVSRKAKP